MKTYVQIMMTSRWIFLRMKNILGKIHRENQYRYFMFINPRPPEIVQFKT